MSAWSKEDLSMTPNAVIGHVSGNATSRELRIGISTPLLRVSFFTPSRCCYGPYFALLTNSTSATFVADSGSRSSCVSLIVIHFDWPKQMRERELGELPLAVFLDIHLSHHKRIGDFVLTDCCLQINVL